MKKAMSLLTATAMAATLLAGCGGGAASSSAAPAADSNSIVEVESVVFYANFGILFALKFFAVSIFYLFANSGNATVMPRLHSNHQN